MLSVFSMPLNHWHWVIIAVVFFSVELLTGSGFLLWPAISASLVALLSTLYPDISWYVQIIIFALGAIASCFLWFRYIKNKSESNDKPLLNERTAQLIGRDFILVDAIKNGRGKVRVGDSYWLVSGEDLPVGQQVRVVGSEGNILQVRSQKDPA